MIVSATELKIKNLAGLIRFFRHTPGIMRQLKASRGVVFVSVRGFRTLTGWESREAMKAFRNGGAHLEAMRNLRRIGQAKSIAWETDTRPDWATARQKLREVPYPEQG